MHRYRPDLIDFYSLTMLGGGHQSCDSNDEHSTTIPKNSASLIIQHIFDTLETELGILPVMSGRELADTTRKPDKLTMMSYLSQIYETFRREIPAAIGTMGGNVDPMSVTIIHGVATSKSYSDDDVLLDSHNTESSVRQRSQRKGIHLMCLQQQKLNVRNKINYGFCYF